MTNTTTTATSNNAADSDTLAALIKPICADIEAWENNERKASNGKLYVLLQSAYTLYKKLDANRDWGKVLTAYLHAQGRGVKANTTLMGKVVRALFDETRNNVTAYVSVLNVVKSNKVEEGKVAAWLEQQGGIYAVQRNARVNNSGVAVQGADDKQARAKLRVENTQAALTVNAAMVANDALGKEQDGEYTLLLARKVGDQYKLLHSTSCKALITEYLNKLGAASPKLDAQQVAAVAQDLATKQQALQTTLAPSNTAAANSTAAAASAA